MTDLSNSMGTQEKPAITEVPIHAEIARRWSPRAFDAAQPVEPQKLTALLEAARWAPSCFGDEPWRFIVADRARDPRAWDAVFQTLAPGNRVWAQYAPVLLVIVADTRFQHNDNPNRWGAYDSGAAAVSMTIEAVAQDLATHQMGGFDVQEIRSACSIPERFIPMAVMAIGYAAAPKILPADLQAGECAPRKRRPLHQTAFAGRWGVTLPSPDSKTS